MKAKNFVENYLDGKEKSIARGKTKLPKILESLKKKKMIDEEMIQYNKKDYPFSYEDFLDVMNYLSTFESHYQLVEGMFDEEKSYFSYNGIEFILSTMSGQGTVSALYLKGAMKNRPYIKKFEHKL